MSPAERITQEVRALAGLDLDGLREAWRRRYGAPPRLKSAPLLARILAWRIQAEHFGGLEPGLRRNLTSARLGGPRKTNLQPGVRLVREWQGRRVEVEITAEGVRHDGVTYRSLSEAARAITGVRWNGPRFFGLRQEKGAS